MNKQRFQMKELGARSFIFYIVSNFLNNIVSSDYLLRNFLQSSLKFFRIHFFFFDQPAQAESIAPDCIQRLT